jgi:hypothetical protein
LLVIFFYLEDGKEIFLPKRRLTFNGIHGVIAQKIALFINIAVRTSNPAIKRWCLWVDIYAGFSVFSEGT